MNIDIDKMDNYNAIKEALTLRLHCNTTPCQKCPFYSAHDCTLRSSAPDAWTGEDWRTPEDI